jgi:hypothetical protein
MMTAPVKLNFKIYQGATFRETLRWESSTKSYRPISSILKSAPVEINTTAEHGIPTGWRVRINNVQGMKEINSDSYYTICSVLPGSFKINEINALGFSNYTSGGVVEFNAPVDLAGVTARMQIREKLDSPEVIINLTTENGGIVIDNVDKTIALFISDTDTAAMTFTSAVYSLELVKAGDVIPFINGNVSLVKEVTR